MISDLVLGVSVGCMLKAGSFHGVIFGTWVLTDHNKRALRETKRTVVMPLLSLAKAK